MKHNNHQRTQDAIVRRASLARSAAEKFAGTIPLRQNHTEAIAADLYALSLRPFNEDEPFRSIEDLSHQAQLNARRSRSSVARANRRAAFAAARAFCAASIGVLKNYFGNRWNPQWQATGFVRNSIAIPEKPLGLIIDLRAYFRTHPEHENDKLGVSADLAEFFLNELDSAEYEVSATQIAQQEARANRNEALKRLKRRLASLRTELALHLGNDDPRWIEFGFRIPSSVRSPEPVEAIEVTAGLPGEVHVQWEPAPRAENYRVSRQIHGVDPQPVEVGLYTGTNTVIRELPEDATVTVFVSARNRRGERLPISSEFRRPH